MPPLYQFDLLMAQHPDVGRQRNEVGAMNIGLRPKRPDKSPSQTAPTRIPNRLAALMMP